MQRSHRALLLTALLAPCSGCCSLASLFCGPDRSRWVEPDFRTPEASIATFREALRREHGTFLFESLAEEWKRRHGIAGAIEFEVLMRKLKEQVPHLHMLGEAEVEPFVVIDPDRLRTCLVRSGYRVRVELVRQRYYEVRYRLGDLSETPGSYVTSFGPLMAVDRDDVGAATVRLRLTGVPLPEGVEVEQVEAAGIGTQWKVSVIEPEPAG